MVAIWTSVRFDPDYRICIGSAVVLSNLFRSSSYWRGEQGASIATIKLSVLMPTMSGLSIYFATVSDDRAGKTRRRQVYVMLEVLIGRSQCGPGCCSACAADAPPTPAG